MKTLLYNGKIWIGKNYFANSVGMDSDTGKIIFVGKEPADDKNIYNEAIDLKGKLVLPAFTDGHCHLFKGALVNSEVNLRYSSTQKEFSDTINNYKSKIKNGEWIVGGYFSEANFTEDITINKGFIDNICSDVPVVLFRTDLHSVVCNSLALEKINLLNHSRNFSDDEVIRDKNNILTGELKEKAMYFVINALPVKSIDEKKEILKRQINKLHSLGITSVTDISWREDLDVYKSLLDDNNLKLKINSVIPFEEIDRIEEYKNEFSAHKEYIRFGALKAFYDGSLSSHTALFFDNYKGTDNNGLRTEQVTSGKLKELAYKIDLASCQLVVHVIGDLAVSEVLDVIEEIRNTNPLWDRRVRLEHIQHVRDKDLYRFKMLDVLSSVQPAHLLFDAKVATRHIQNPETTHVFKKLIDEGNRICFGTDFPVVPENPFDSIYIAMTREAVGYPEGFNTDMCLDLVTCLEAYTINNAYASYEEDTKGSIRDGKYADLIVLDRDIFSVGVKEIKNAVVESAFINGRNVYSV
jgi:predicted amidohydrolase YtcJ